MWTPHKEILNVIRLESWPVFHTIPVELLIRITHVAVKVYGEKQPTVHALMHTVDACTYIIGDSKELGLSGNSATDPREVKLFRGVSLKEVAFAPCKNDPFLVVLCEAGHVWCTDNKGNFHKVAKMPVNVTSVACVAKDVIVLDSYGCVYKMSRCGGKVKKIYEGIDPASRIACGESHSVLLTQNSRLYIWGSDSFGQMGKGTCDKHLKMPTLILNDTSIELITCGSNTTAVVTHARQVLSWGSNDNGSVGIRQHGGIVTEPHTVLENQTIIAIKSVCDTTVVVSQESDIIVWGDPSMACAASGTTVMDNHYFPTDILAAVTCMDTGGLVTVDPGSIYLLVWKDPKIFRTLRDELVTTLTRGITTPGRKRVISSEGGSGSTDEERTSPDGREQINDVSNTPEVFQETTNADNTEMKKKREDCVRGIKILFDENVALQKTQSGAGTKPMLKKKPLPPIPPAREREESSRRIEELEQLRAERDAWKSEAEKAATESSKMTEELEQLRAESDSWMKEAEKVAAESCRRTEELGQLRAERDTWKMEAENAATALKDKEHHAQEQIKRVRENWQFTYDAVNEETARLKEANSKLKQYIQSNLADDASLAENMNASDTLQKVLDEKDILEKKFAALKQEIQAKAESYDLIVGENAYLKQRLETVITEMLKKIEGAQEDILIKLKADMEDSNKGMRLEIAQLRQNNEYMQMYISVSKKGVISFSVLHYVAQHITDKWYMLGRELDLGNSTLEHIDHDMKALKDKGFKVLMTWYERAKETATKDKLLYALRELPRKDIADNIANME